MFKFTEEQLMIRDMVKEFTANEVEPRDRDMDENGFDFDLIPKLVDAGLIERFNRPVPGCSLAGS